MRNWRVLLLALLLVLAPARVLAEDPDAVRMLAHSPAQLQKLDREYLRAIFTLRTGTWPDGKPVRVFVLNDAHPTHQALCQHILGLFPYILRQAWDKALFTGTGLVPEELESESEMQQRVANTPGAIGYVSQVDLQNGPQSLGPIRRTEP